MCKTEFSGLLLGILIANCSFAAETTREAASNQNNAYIGAGPYIQSQPYQGAAPLVLPTPVIFFDNRLVYVRWTRIGLYVFGKQNWGVSLTAQPRPWGYEGTDSSWLSGMEQRQPSWEGGVAIGGKNRWGFAELTYFQDVLNRSNGSLVRLELGKTVTSGRWFNMPSVYVIRYSDAMLNYYYGVRPQESTLQRPVYDAKAGINFALQHFLMFEMSKHWFFCANARVDYLASEITRSPLVDDQWMGSVMVSLLYKFVY